MEEHPSIEHIIKDDLRSYIIENNVFEILCQTIKTIITIIVRETYTYAQNENIRLKHKIIYKINNKNKIFKDLQNINENKVNIRLNIEVNIWKLYEALDKNKSVTKGLIKQINAMANYYYNKIISSCDKKISYSSVTHSIKALFSTDIYNLIIKSIDADNFSENSSSDDSFSGVYSAQLKSNKDAYNMTNNDIFATQLTLDSDAQKNYSQKYISNVNPKPVSALDIISTYRLI